MRHTFLINNLCTSNYNFLAQRVVTCSIEKLVKNSKPGEPDLENFKQKAN